MNCFRSWSQPQGRSAGQDRRMLEGRLLTAGFLALMWGLDYLTLNLALFLALGVFLATGGKHTLYLAYHTLPRDLRGAFRYLRLLFLVYTYQKRNLTVPKVRLLNMLVIASPTSPKTKNVRTIRLIPNFVKSSGVQ